MEILQSLQYSKVMEKKEEQRTTIRKRNLLVLVHKYLKDLGYLKTVDALKTEATFKMDQYYVCDNVHLELVLQEYETFQYVKFRQYPHVVKKITGTDTCITNINNIKRPPPKPRLLVKSPSIGSSVSSSPVREFSPVRNNSNYFSQTRNAQPNDITVETNTRPKSKSFEKCDSQTSSVSYSDLSVEGLPFGKYQIPTEKMAHNSPFKREQPRQFQPNMFGYNLESKSLAEVISKEMFFENPNVKWDNIVGLETAKRLIKEAVVYPIKHPRLFSGLLSPWKGLLLFGPPGNGKTLLAKAVATECQTTFFNISASTIVSKWRGDSEKLVRTLFEMARFYAPSTIFLDELDALMCKRDSSGNSEHEASRRMKTELLVQMDGLCNSDELVFLLAASNMPWDLDMAILRRLEKRILVPLPNTKARRNMLQFMLPFHTTHSEEPELKVPVANLDYDYLAKLTDGYSGADLKIVCKESAMEALRSVFQMLDDGEEDETKLRELLKPVNTENVAAAIKRTKPSVKGVNELYNSWQSEFGSA